MLCPFRVCLYHRDKMLYQYSFHKVIAIRQSCHINYILILYIMHMQGLQEKFCKVEQYCFVAPETGWDFSQK